mmetsp:Transcript_30289/g.77235  ORF Transcript_30289/g.77235 Transcript_30289/m.77235 type:complete len:155 (-) Transcript_30289:527-991(-)
MGSKVELSPEEVAEFREIFDLMDKDHGGSLNAEEIKQLMDMLGMRVRPDELDAILKEIDTDGSGQVDFDEFLQVMARPQELPYKRADVLRAFNMFRQPGEPEGHIHPEALEQALVKYAGDKYSQEEILRLINGLDLTPEGLVDFSTKVNLFVPQ